MLACVQGAGGVVTESSFLGPFCLSAVRPAANKCPMPAAIRRGANGATALRAGEGERLRPGGSGSRPLNKVTLGPRFDGSEGWAVWTWVKSISGRGTAPAETSDRNMPGRRVWPEPSK